MAYQIPILSELVNQYGSKVHVIHWDDNLNSLYVPPTLDGVTFYRRSKYQKSFLKDLIKQINPDLVYISGWQDKGYLSVVSELRKINIPIVAGFDDQWNGSLKQWLGALALQTYFRKKYFSHAWVAGPYQYEYARKIGFKKHEIIFNLLSCDSQIFDISKNNNYQTETSYSNHFLYAGNFRYVKGTDILLKAFEYYRSALNGKWGLICVGNGPLDDLVKQSTNVKRKGFSSQSELVKISQSAGAFVLPSRFDQWGVVVQEAALSGLPLILSENVGSHPVFLINGYNGYLYKNNCPFALGEAMKKIEGKSQSELVLMSKRSISLGRRLSPKISAASLMSVFE